MLPTSCKYASMPSRRIPKEAEVVFGERDVPAEPIRRYERERPGELIHLETSQAGRDNCSRRSHQRIIQEFSTTVEK
jgi:hypothetical protein